MTLRLLQTAAACALLAAPAMLSAQAQISANEEERLEALARENAEVYMPKSTVSVGFRMLSSGARTHFGSLGIVDFSTTVAPASAGSVLRTYNNGYVNVDAARAAELDANGVQVSLAGGRYITTTTDATTGVTSKTGDFRSYTPGTTRNWSYGSANQTTIRPGYIAMSSYSASSDGGFRDKKQGPSGGVELQFTQFLGRLSKRTEWSLLTGISLNNINNKVGGDVLATLHTNTDFYSLNGAAAPALPSTTDATTGVVTTTPYIGPSFANVTAADGTILVTGGFETTAPIAATPDSSASSSLVGGTTVHGNWQVKGAYFMVKLGPSVRAQLTERLGINASLGVAGAYAGTRYTAVESFSIPDVGGTISTPTALQQSFATKFLGGFYADFNLEWAANERTGLFTGVTAQKFGNYEQTVGGRTARIDIGSSVGIRGGISIKF